MGIQFIKFWAFGVILIIVSLLGFIYGCLWEYKDWKYGRREIIHKKEYKHSMCNYKIIKILIEDVYSVWFSWVVLRLAFSDAFLCNNIIYKQDSTKNPIFLTEEACKHAWIIALISFFFSMASIVFNFLLEFIIKLIFDIKNWSFKNKRFVKGLLCFIFATAAFIGFFIALNELSKAVYDYDNFGSST